MNRSIEFWNRCFYAFLVLFPMIFLTIIFYYSKQAGLGMEIPVVCLLFAVSMIGLVIGGHYLFQKRFLLFSEKICNHMDVLMDQGIVETDSYEETLPSKITMRLKKLIGVTTELAARSDRQKQEVQQMVSDISHQLKTPIANIVMYSDTIADLQLPREQELKFLNVMRQQVKKLDFLVQALIKMSRLESHMISLQKENTFLFQTIAHAVSSAALSAEKKKIKLVVSCDEKLLLRHDVKWTGEAIFNVLDNAVKYSHEGGEIKLTAEQWQMYTKVEIEDNGIGIAPEHKNDIFKRFYRENTVHQAEGIGVGLYLTRHIFAQQGGYIKVNSALGKGSVFSLFLPNDPDRGLLSENRG